MNSSWKWLCFRKQSPKQNDSADAIRILQSTLYLPVVSFCFQTPGRKLEIHVLLLLLLFVVVIIIIIA